MEIQTIEKHQLQIERENARLGHGPIDTQSKKENGELSLRKKKSTTGKGRREEGERRTADWGECNGTGPNLILEGDPLEKSAKLTRD